MKQPAKTCLTVLGLLLGAVGAQAQKCGVAWRQVDFQTVLPNGDVVLLATRLSGSMMDGTPDKGFAVNAIRLNVQGKLLRDTLVFVLWPERYYNISTCQALYHSGANLSPYGVDSAREGRCGAYVPFLAPAGGLVVGHYLLNDPAFAYELRIDAQGQVRSAALNLKKHQPYRTGLAKVQQVGSYLQRRHRGLVPPAAPGFTVESARRIRLTTHPQVRLLPDAQDSLPAARAHRRPRWRVQGPNWEVALPGAVLLEAPCISVRDNLLYLTVERTAPCHCPPQPDWWPAVCCIDLTTGALRWQYDALPVRYGCRN